MAEKAEKEFLSFDEALRELRLKEEELKRLVSEGEIRAFRDGATMKLRKADVESLRNELSGGEVVELGGASEELVFEDDTDVDAGMATEEISEADTILEEKVEVVTAEQPAGTAAAGVYRATATRRSSPAASRAAALAEEEGGEPGWMRAVLVLTSILMVLALPVCLAAASGTASGFAKAIANLIADFPE